MLIGEIIIGVVCSVARVNKMCSLAGNADKRITLGTDRGLSVSLATYFAHKKCAGKRANAEKCEAHFVAEQIQYA